MPIVLDLNIMVEKMLSVLRKPIPLVNPHDRIGDHYLHCDPDKVIAIIETHSPQKQIQADHHQPLQAVLLLKHRF